jgi:hypothetical protein
MPKTGGTTLKNIIKRNLQPSTNYDIYQNHQQREQTLKAISHKPVSCIQGHFPFGIHQYFTNLSTYITMLREPTQRIISEYYFIRNNPRHNLYHKVNSISLEDYQRQPQNMNLQTRLISGQINHPVTNVDLEKAKQNIEQYFSVVGLTEMFNESIYLMKRKFGWTNIQYRKQNITKKKPTIDKLPTKTISSITEHNHFDIKLYYFAKQILTGQINNLPPKSKRELNKLR